MNKLHDLTNISKVIEGLLLQAGIETPDKLKDLGSKDAFIRIRLIDNTACINMLYALEGAIEGIRWHNLSDSKKQELKEFYKTL